jgi:uncharacterized repeat protein (TIGR03803 family)
MRHYWVKADKGRRNMKIVYHGIAISMVGLIPASGALAAPVMTVLHSFEGSKAGAFPFAGLVADDQGALYGTTAYGGNGGESIAGGLGTGNGTVFKLTPPRDGQTTWTKTVIYRFCPQPGCGDGARPYGGLFIDKSGALYGATYAGGSTLNSAAGHGTVYKLTPPEDGQTAWTESVLYRFQGGGDGSGPSGDLKVDEQGAIYGTTADGGRIGAKGDGYGTVFKLTPPGQAQEAWTETVLYRFQGGSDGRRPDGDLKTDEKGAFYGTTGGGGNIEANGLGYGTVFKLTPPAKGRTDWTETVLYRFQGGSDGRNPEGEVVADELGALYGVTYAGGDGGGLDGKSGNGTVFKLTPPVQGQDAWTETVLYRFQGGGDGAVPALRTGLLVDEDGALYGTTTSGGRLTEGGAEKHEYGTVFKLTPPDGDQTAWTETVLYRFRGGGDGAYPDSGLIAGQPGVLYGTTQGGGESNSGAVFRLTLCPDLKARAPRGNDQDADKCPVFLSSEAPFPAPGTTRFVYRPVESVSTAQSVPALSERPHRLAADIETSGSGAEGVIVEQGGYDGGYSLFVQDGKLTFESASGQTRQTLVAPWPLPPGKVRVAFEFEPDAGPIATLATLLGRKNESGTGRLLINGVEAAKAHFKKLGSAPAEKLDIGKDTDTPVSPAYATPFAFTGKVEKIEIDLDPTSSVRR